MKSNILEKIDILHLTHSDPRSDNRILKELGALADTGLYNVTCIGFASKEGASHSNNELGVKLIILGSIKIPQWVPWPIRPMLILLDFYFRLFIAAVKIKPVVVHCHDVMALPVGLLIKKISKAKLIYDAHELESNKNSQSKKWSKIILRFEKKAWPQIDHFISVSNSIIDWYENNLGIKSHSLILNTPFIDQIDSVPNKYFHKLYNIHYDKSVFVYLGILCRGRGIDYILEAFSSGSITSHVVFVGYGELLAKTRAFSLKHTNIHLHDAVPHEDVVALVKNADVGLCLIENISLSDYYCLPNKLFEYTFAGLPILASDFPDISQVVEKYGLGKLCAINSKSINQAVIEIESEPLKRVNTDLTSLGWEKQAERLQKAYAKLLNQTNLLRSSSNLK